MRKYQNYEVNEECLLSKQLRKALDVFFSLPPSKNGNKQRHERRAEIKIQNVLEYVSVLLPSSLVKMQSLLGFRRYRRWGWVRAWGIKDWWEKDDKTTLCRDAHLYIMWLSQSFRTAPYTSGYKYSCFCTHYLLSLIAHLGVVVHSSKTIFDASHVCAFPSSFVTKLHDESAMSLPRFPAFKLPRSLLPLVLSEKLRVRAHVRITQKTRTKRTCSGRKRLSTPNIEADTCGCSLLLGAEIYNLTSTLTFSPSLQWRFTDYF